MDVVRALVTETAPDLNIGCLEMVSHRSVVTQSERGYSGESGFDVPNASSLAADAALPFALSQ